MAHEPATAVRSSHVTAKRERRRAEILHGALRAFRDKGYHATTLGDIADHVGVRKTALYHYFPDKQSILVACHRESLAELDRIIKDTRDLATAADKLGHVIREHVRVMTDTLEGSPLAFEVTALPKAHQAELMEGRDRYERAVRKIIELGIKRGEFKKQDAKIAVFAILGAINWIARWYRPDGSYRAAELGEQFADHLVGGLRKH